MNHIGVYIYLCLSDSVGKNCKFFTGIFKQNYWPSLFRNSQRHLISYRDLKQNTCMMLLSFCSETHM